MSQPDGEALVAKGDAKPCTPNPRKTNLPQPDALITKDKQTEIFSEKIALVETGFIPLQPKIPFMRPRTPYVATCTSAAPERGMRLQNWVNNRGQMEVDGEARVVVKSNLKGVVIRPVGAYNKTFGVYINKLCPIKQKLNAQKT